MGTPTALLATAHAARGGVTAAQTAAHGCRGPRKILEGPLGFFRLYYPEANPGQVLVNPDDPWKVHEISFKPWPACRHVHPVIDLAVKLHERIVPETVSEVRIGIYSAAIDFCDNDNPTAPHEARFSLQHCVAVALQNGTVGLSDCHDEMLLDAAVTRLRKCVTVKENRFLSHDFPGQMGATLEVRTKDGNKLKLATANAAGDPEMPLDEAALQNKFVANLDWGGAEATDGRELALATLALPHAKSMTRFNRALDLVANSINHAKTMELAND